MLNAGCNNYCRLFILNLAAAARCIFGAAFISPNYCVRLLQLTMNLNKQEVNPIARSEAQQEDMVKSKFCV